MSILDEDAIPNHLILLAVGVFLTLVSVAVVLTPEIRPGYVVLSLPIAVGALILAARAYLTRS